MEIALLGPLELDGRTLTSAKERAIVELLALRAPRPVPAADLVGALWGSEPPPSAERTLQSLVSRLRSKIPELAIARVGDAYRASIEPDEVDAHRFEQLFVTGTRCAEAGDHDAAVEALNAARALWRSPAATDLEDGHAASEPARLQELYRCLIEELADARLAGGEHTTLIPELLASVASEPLRERRWGQLMVALARDGRRAEALRTFQDLRRMLADELGLEPSAELVALDREIATDELSFRADKRDVAPLPTWLTSFVGRTDDERIIAKRLQQHRAVTVTGPGGAGKTRVACVVAQGLADRFADGVRFIDLAPVRNPSRVPLAFGAALDVRETPGTRVVDAVISGCGALDALFVVDNCEHVIAEVAVLVEQILRASSSVHVLATSREPLGIHGEAILSLLPLPVPDDRIKDVAQLAMIDSVRLYVDRASEIDPTFALDADCGPTVASLCRQLDGLPLAIELAAAQSDVLSLADLDATIAARAGVVRNRERSAVDRHRSLETVVDWSLDLLDEVHRAVLERMAVFHGSASLDAIESVVSDSRVARDQVFELVTGLVRRSLAVAEPGGAHMRYRLLETIRARGLLHLTERGEVDRFRERHFTWMYTWAERAAVGLAGREQSAWLDRVALEQDNIDAALAWGTANPARAAQALEIVGGLFSHWIARGIRRADGVRWLSAAVAAAKDADPGDRAAALAQGVMIICWNDLDLATALAARAREVSDSAPHDAVARGYADLAAAGVAGFSGDGSLHEYAMSARARLDGYPHAMAEMLVAMELDGEARYHALVANALRFRELGDEHIYGGNLGGIVETGMVAGIDAQVLRAQSAEGLAIARSFGCTSCEALGLGAAALVERLDDPHRALATAQRSLVLAHSIAETFGVIIALDVVVGLMGLIGRTEDATKLAGASDVLRAATGYHAVFPGRHACRIAGLAVADAQLGSAEREALLAEGATLSYEHAVQLAVS